MSRILEYPSGSINPILLSVENQTLPKPLLVDVRDVATFIIYHEQTL